MLEVNGAKCHECGTIVISRSRHDFRWCACPDESGIFVDGGHDYQRIGYMHDNFATFTTNAEYVKLLDGLEDTNER